MAWTLHAGDCVEVMKRLPDNSVDSVVTDPPYELGFMGKKWDSAGIAYNVAMWREVLRVLKPGGYLLSFGGTRTYHRMACAIEDAGFEVRDQLQWWYATGFPKSMNIGNAIYKAAGNVTSEAEQWDGWGTALKPAHEPICMARKPLSESTVAANVLKWGTGGLNVDGCRIELNGEVIERPSRFTGHLTNSHMEMRPWMLRKHEAGEPPKPDFINTTGRFPANILLDEEAAAMLDEQSGVSKSVRSQRGASRFFYVAKASKSERGEGNLHPTVKPVQLMCYLVRLITPPNGTVLDPFAGSGTTLLAAEREGFDSVGIEMNPEYCEIIRRRMAGMQPVQATLL